MLYKEWRTAYFKFGLELLAYIMLGLLLTAIWFSTSNQAVSLYQNWCNLSIYVMVVSGLLGGVDLVSAEKEKGTLSFLLTRPLSRYHIYLAKVLVNHYILLITYGGISLIILTLDQFGPKPANLGEAVLSTLLVFFIGVAFVNLGSLISVFARATLLALSLTIGIATLLGIGLYRLAWILQIDSYVSAHNINYLAGNLIAILIIGSLAVGLLWIGCSAFENHEF